MKSKNQDNTGHQGFTLVELLAFIAVIAILTAVLVPVLIAARKRAVVTQCLNNEKQIGMAGLVYLRDNDDFFPYGVDIKNDPSWSSNSAWHVMLLAYIGCKTNGHPKLYICPSDSTGAAATYPVPPGYIRFQEDYRANDYIFRDSTRNPKNPLRSATLRSPSDMLMTTEKEYDSPNFQVTSEELGDNGWLGGWNGSGGKNYFNSGFERHRYLPTAAAADGHACRFRVPSFAGSNSGSVIAVPDYYPGLGDTRGTSGLWSASAPVLFMRDFATAAGF